VECTPKWFPSIRGLVGILMKKLYGAVGNSECLKVEIIKYRREAAMKTGTTANDKGLYSSECCNCEVVFDEGDTLTRCPKCNGLTLWDFAGDTVLVA